MILIVCPTPSFQRRMVFKKVITNQVNRTSEVEHLASGKGLNCARAIARLGGLGMNLLFLGGQSGKWMQEQMKEEGLESTVIEVLGRTRMCCTLIEEETGNVTELVENASKIYAAENKLFMSAYSECLSKIRVVVLIGSLPEGTPQEMYREMIFMAHQKNVPTIVDAQGEPLLRALEAKPFLVKPNKMELEAVTLIDCSKQEGLLKAIHYLHQFGARWVLITDGAKPATLSNGKEYFLFYPPKVLMRNPIGSGDSLTGGLAVALTGKKSMPDAVRFAIACGAANAASDGYGRIDPVSVNVLEKEVNFIVL